MNNHRSFKGTHPCTREGPCPIVDFVMNERGGSILSHTIDLNSHEKLYLNRHFCERKKFSVRDHIRPVTPAQVPAWVCDGPGGSSDHVSLNVFDKLIADSKLKPTH